MMVDVIIVQHIQNLQVLKDLMEIVEWYVKL